MVVELYKYKWKALRLLGVANVCYQSLLSRINAKPFSHFSLHNHNQLLVIRHLTTTTTTSPPEISPETQQHSNFTVNYLIHSCGLSPEGAILASKRVKLKSPEKPNTVLAFLRNHGFSETQISKVVRSCSEVLGVDPDKILLPKIEFFISLGVSNEELASILASSPQLLATSLQKRIVPTCDFLRSMLSEKNVAAVIKRCSKIFLEGHSKYVVPNIGLLRELGMPQSHISLFLAHSTSELMRKPKEFGEVVDEVKKMGFNLQKSTSVNAMRALSGKNKLILNRSRDVLGRWGWSEDDFLSAFRKSPQSMIVSEKKLMQSMDLLVNKMGWSSGMIAKCPVVLALSLEKRLIPRCSVVKVLLLKGLITENLNLSGVLKHPEKHFLERFVNRYVDRVPQLLNVYQGKVDIQHV